MSDDPRPKFFQDRITGRLASLGITPQDSPMTYRHLQQQATSILMFLDIPTKREFWDEKKIAYLQGVYNAAVKACKPEYMSPGAVELLKGIYDRKPTDHKDNATLTFIGTDGKHHECDRINLSDTFAYGCVEPVLRMVFRDLGIPLSSEATRTK